MANVVDPNVLYRAGAVKGALIKEAKDYRKQSFQKMMGGIGAVGNIINQKQNEYDKNMSDFNGEIPRDDVPESAMMDLTRHIAREKSVYTKNAKIIRSSLSRKKKREAMEENEKIKSGLAAVYSDFKKAKAMGQQAEKLIPFLAKGADLEKKDNALDFANNKWYERGVKFTRDGMTINGVREEQVIGEDGQPLPQSKLVNYDQRLSDISFPDPVKGTGVKAFSETATVFQKEGLKNGRLLTQDAMNVKKAEYVQGLKNMPVEEQRHLYFNGVGGFPGSSQAETDAAKAIGLDAKGFEKMNQAINEDDPNYANVMRLRTAFQNELNALTTRKDFLTPELIENQWSTIQQAYESGIQEHERVEAERTAYRNRSTGRKGNYIIGGSQINAETFEQSYTPFIKFIEGGQNGQRYTSPRGAEYKKEDNKFFVWETRNEKTDWYPVTQRQMARTDFISNYVNITDGAMEGDLNVNKDDIIKYRGQKLNLSNVGDYLNEDEEEQNEEQK